MMKFKLSETGRARYGRHTPGVMNKTETRYAETLFLRKAAGEIIEYKFEAVTLKLADRLRFTPDFMVLLSDGSIEFIDVKGGGPIQDDALAKIKMAALVFPMFTFAQEIELPRKGGFERRVF